MFSVRHQSEKAKEDANMDRLSSKLRKGGAAAVAAAGKHGVAPFLGKFKLHTSKDSLLPLPLLTSTCALMEKNSFI